jgi:hypothetical protein
MNYFGKDPLRFFRLMVARCVCAAALAVVSLAALGGQPAIGAIWSA